jgi:hypothetical protein
VSYASKQISNISVVFLYCQKKFKSITIGLFRYIKILTSIQSWEAETREITLRPKGIRIYFFALVFSFTASQSRNEAEYVIYRKWVIREFSQFKLSISCHAQLFIKKQTWIVNFVKKRRVIRDKDPPALPYHIDKIKTNHRKKYVKLGWVKQLWKN